MTQFGELAAGEADTQHRTLTWTFMTQTNLHLHKDNFSGSKIGFYGMAQLTLEYPKLGGTIIGHSKKEAIRKRRPFEKGSHSPIYSEL